MESGNVTEGQTKHHTLRDASSVPQSHSRMLLGSLAFYSHAIENIKNAGGAGAGWD